MMAIPSRKAWLVLGNTLIPIAVLVFATGFFPYKPFVPGLAKHDGLAYGPPPVAQFDKLVFMVVDALRSDFVYGHASGFSFTQSLIRAGEALPFTAHATSPTITMPRVKAITTGSIPSFLDVILNFAESDTTSTLATQDTWLAQIKDKLHRGNGLEKHDSPDQVSGGGRLVMYGDDTWLKLFPSTFIRADGTSSFFVSDFTEVDNNVTRHVPHELRSDDWDAMIMHYLGLDHIGHKAGPLSPNMVPKQTEMDGIVRQIYEAMQTFDHLKGTLLVLCGDHGMNDGGNHGGSAPGETSPALVFISPKLKSLGGGKPCPTEAKQDFEYYSVIEQSDIAPTLAGLLGIPVPLNNLGVFIPDFLPLWTDPSDQLQLLLRNAMQILEIVKATFSDIDFSVDVLELLKEVNLKSGEDNGSAIRASTSSDDDSTGGSLAKLWDDVQSKLPKRDISRSKAFTALEALYKFCRKAQEVMSSTASNYDVVRLQMGIMLTSASVGFGVMAAQGLPISILDGAVAAIITLLYGTMMFASSYVEEEQHFWYWITSGWLAYLCYSRLRTEHKPVAYFGYVQLVLALHRLSRRWNQTGQKFAGAPDITQGILRPHPLLLWTLIAATYFTVLGRIGEDLSKIPGSGSALGTASSLLLVIPAFTFKLGFTAKDAPELLAWCGEKALRFFEQIPLVGNARIVFLMLLAETSWVCAAAATANATTSRTAKSHLPATLIAFLTLFSITQSRATNIPLFLLFFIQYNILRRLKLSTTQITITALLLGQASFFALGNSNAISSIDLSNAYNGVAGFNVVAVGVLVFLSNWAGPVWWSVAGVALLIERVKPIDLAEGRHKRKSWVQREMDHLLSAGVRTTPSEQPEVNGEVFATHATLLTLFTSISLLAVMVACTMLRTHLFIWTVFSPKYLYAMAWSMAFHLLVSMGLGSLIWSFCVP